MAGNNESQPQPERDLRESPRSMLWRMAAGLSMEGVQEFEALCGGTEEDVLRYLNNGGKTSASGDASSDSPPAA